MKLNNIRIKHKCGSNSYWSSQIDFVPLKGELIIYDDHQISVTAEGSVITSPGFKIGDGTTLLHNLPFSDEYLVEQLQDHILNTEMHLEEGERDKWNNKVSLEYDANSEMIIFKI